MTTYLIDAETTGVVEPIEPIEVAWLELGDLPELRVVREFCERYRPTKPIELGAMATHGIMDEDLATCPPSSEFKLPDDCTIIVGHQVDYDHKVIGSPEVQRIDTLAMARKIWPQADSHKLGALLYHIARERARCLLREAHSALGDVTNCLVVLHAICDKLAVTSWEKLWEFSEAARVPDAMPFGKHRGTAMADVPRDYKDWLLRQPDVDSYLRTALSR